MDAAVKTDNAMLQAVKVGSHDCIVDWMFENGEGS
jgi:hypothetical protein